jgi:hypothetical protein
MPNFAIGNTAPLQVPLTTGVIRSFPHITLNVAGLDFTGGFKEIKYSRKRNREMVRSNSPDPIGKTLGENEYAASGIFYYDWFMNLLQTVQSTLGPGYGDALFTILCSYSGAGLTPYQDTLIGCSFDSTDASNTQGVGALTRSIEFNPIKIKFANVDDLAVALTAPPQ